MCFFTAFLKKYLNNNVLMLMLSVSDYLMIIFDAKFECDPFDNVWNEKNVVISFW